MAETSTTPPRLVSLDQFRGYTVAGMFLVNFVGSYVAIREFLPVLKHWHTYCSYADTIMPQFFFAVGFAYRLTFLRRVEKEGTRAAYIHSVRRNLALLLVGFIIYHLDGKFDTWEKLREQGIWGFFANSFQRNFFQTLTHIAVTSFWIMPVIGRGAWWRVSFAVLSAMVFQFSSEFWYYDWVMKRPGIDGGPLGFLTWTIPMIAGSLVHDVVSSGKENTFRQLFLWGFVIALLGYGFSCLNRVTLPNHLTTFGGILIEPPFIAPSQPVNIWTMSQRAGSLSYLTFATGFSLMVFAIFHLLCDRMKILKLGMFRTLGTNALAAYILHGLVDDAVKPLAPRDSPFWFVTLAFLFFFLTCYLALRWMEKQKLILKL